MLVPAIVRALRQPPFLADDFTATRFATAEDKAAFGNELMRFIAADFPQGRWNERLYRRLSNCFGHIAHCDRFGFYETCFTCHAHKVRFLRDTLRWVPCGDPRWTWCDIERAVMHRLHESGVLRFYEAADQHEVEQIERALLARLQEKYAPVPPPLRMPRDLFDAASQEMLSR